MTSDYQEGGMSESKIFGKDVDKYVPDVERSSKMFDYHIQNMGQIMTSGFSDLFKLLKDLSTETNNEQAKAVAKGVQAGMEAERQKGNQFP